MRRNYEMLSEAVRLMGVVAGAAGTVGSRPAPPPPAAAPPAPQAQAPAPTPPVQQAPAAQAAPPPAPPLARPAPAAAPPSPEAGLRPRLRLTPTASDEEFKTVFDAAGGRDPPETVGDSWTWKELLSSVDEAPAGTPASGTPASDEALLNEIDTMGIDAGALLPRARLEEIAAALQQGDPDAGRQVVRRLAPAAIRRLSRRMMTDRAFRAHAERFARRYQAMLAEAGRDRDGVVASALLGSDQGRAFLLIDAAAGEVA